MPTLYPHRYNLVMSYIKKEERERLNPLIELLDGQDIRSAEELSYLITMMLHKYLNQKPESYQMYNDAIGALECAKMELYRRHVSLLENDKIKDHGDV